MAFLPARWRVRLSYLAIFAPLAAVYLLPPDTSLQEVRRAGILRACVPNLYPPLVTADAAAPGIDIELLDGVARKLGVRLDLSRNEAMARDFNPRGWHVTRAQCEVLGGGIVASPVTRSFLETSPPYEETGWAFIEPVPLAAIEERRAGVLAGVSGLDRIALGRFLREHKVELTITPDAAGLVKGLRDGRFDFAVTERLLAEGIATREGWHVQWAPLPRYPLVIGLWKGDLTLKRAIVDALAQLERNGETAAILARYLGARRTAALPE
jgi:polar amino acid transport system substrate-binding protein/cystine transport system substrate-binding protein/membrane-bound lytic murein transglycosylase F